MVSQGALPPSSASGPRDVPRRRFQFTGSLLESSFYIERPADRLLPEVLLGGRYCHILAPRQMGKSSLRVRTARALAERGVKCASVDLTAVGTAASEDEWFFGLTEEIARRLRTEDPAAFWEKHRNVAPARRFGDYLRHLVRTELDGQRVVVFLDEIEAVRLARFGLEDFFLTIRALYEERSEDADLRRLTFCLIGVTTPNDLVKNKAITPFNVSEAIPLDDFTRSELDALAPGLDALGARVSALLDAIYAWTEGHPYMTMRACAALAARGHVAAGAEDATVADVVRGEFLERPLEDPNLNYAARRFEDASFGRPGAMLTDKILLYRSLLLGEEVAANTESAVQMELRLCGMVKDEHTPEGRKLKARNRIVSTALDMDWLKSKGERRFIAEAVWKWIESGRGEDALLRGVVLEDALRLAKTTPLSDDERAFLDASQRYETAELGERRATIQTEVTQVERELAEIARDKERIEQEKEQAERERAEIARDKERIEQEKEQAENERAALERQLKEVKRGKSEVEKERERLATSIRTLRRIWLRTGIAGAMALLAIILAAAAALRAAEAERAEAVAELNKAENLLAETKSKHSEELERFKAEMARLQAGLGQLDIEKANLQEELARLHAERSVLLEEQTKVNNYIERNKSIINDLRNALAKRTEDLEAAQRNLESTNRELSSTRASLESANRELSSTRASLESTRASLESANRELNSTRASLESANRELSSTRASLESANRDLSGTRASLESANRDLSSTRASLESANRELERVRAQLNEARQNCPAPE